MPFGVAKNGMRMYVPSWQMQPGSGMKAANRQAYDSYVSNLSAIGGSLFGATAEQTSGIVELTSRMVVERLQSEYSKKLEQAKAGLDVIL